jgi:hypothetical protein
MTTSFRRFLAPVLLLMSLVGLRAQTQVTFTFGGIVNGADAAGYHTNDPLSFSFVLSTAATPVGGFNSPYIYWIRDNSTSLFSSVSATGLTGTWNGTTNLGAVTDDEIVIQTGPSPATIDFLSNASSDNLRLFTPDATPVSLISIQAQWTGLILPNSGIADPVAYFGARTGTYSLVPGSSFGSAYIDFSGGSVAFLPATLTISASAIPEPATTGAFAALGVLSFAVVRRRRQA